MSKVSQPKYSEQIGLANQGTFLKGAVRMKLQVNLEHNVQMYKTRQGNLFGYVRGQRVYYEIKPPIEYTAKKRCLGSIGKNWVFRE